MKGILGFGWRLTPLVLAVVVMLFLVGSVSACGGSAGSRRAARKQSQQAVTTVAAPVAVTAVATSCPCATAVTTTTFTQQPLVVAPSTTRFSPLRSAPVFVLPASPQPTNIIVPLPMPSVVDCPNGVCPLPPAAPAAVPEKSAEKPKRPTSAL